METPGYQTDSSSLPAPDTTPGHQTWTISGRPIVDGKYQDASGVIRHVGADEWTSAGHPALDVFWVNRQATPDQPAPFRALASHAFVGVTEYIRRMGAFLEAADGVCQVLSLNATMYAVNVVVAMDLSRDEVVALLFQQRLAPAH